MTLRNSSGKFSLPHFGRKSSGIQEPGSPVRTNGNFEEQPNGGSSALDGIGRKLGKSIAHQSLLPGLGNKDLRVLQDIIAAEKGVLTATEKLGIETQRAAGALPAFGAQEGPDLQDVLTHSSTLLNQLGTALAVFVDHSANLRGCYKRIREREEELDELRRRRRATGAKAESAEKKLAKMGPENKALPSQTELLERLRGDMRQMDTDIINEESKIGDYKRQQIKEALSYKFGGLEELGEKMCIIGELGKLLLEEIPLEETPPGYGRAPYLGFDKTENAVNEATKCLATVKFVAGSANPKAPGLPPHNPTERLSTPQLPSSRDISAAEEFAHYPGGAQAASPAAEKTRFALDSSNPYGGVSNPYESSHQYGDFGGTRDARHVVFQGPTDEAIQQNGAQDYEYEQQKQLDEEERAWRGGQASSENPTLAPVEPQNGRSDTLDAPWQPLNVKRDRAPTPIALHDNAVPHLDQPDLGERITAENEIYVSSPGGTDLPHPPPVGGAGPPTPSEREGFYTPLQGPTPEPAQPAQMPDQAEFSAPPPPAPLPLPSPVITSNTAQSYMAAGSGKISASAFRKKQRGSTGPDEIASPTERSPERYNGARRLPQPPGGPQTPIEAGFELPASPIVNQEKKMGDAYAEADAVEQPPPQYHPEGQYHQEPHQDSLR